MRCNNADEKVLGELSLRDIEFVFKNIMKYNYGDKYTYPDSVVSCIQIYEGWDTERGSSEKTITVYRYPDTEKRYGKEIWQAGIEYESTSGEVYDFVAT